jgi:hypothetical protein
MLFLALLLACLVGVVVAAVLARRGFARARSGRLRAVVLLAGAGAVAVYTWGLLHVGWAVARAEDGGTGSAPIGPCAGPALASQVDGYAVGYLPLRFECRLTGGGAYVAPSVPGYVNPATAVLALTAAGSWILARRTDVYSSDREK